jgi:L-threonylcarbamoyladenylate synthase
VKGRPSFNPLISHLADAKAAFALARPDMRTERLAAAFWPGPLTMVLRRRDNCPVSLLATAGLETIALRVPDHPIAREVLRQAGRPIAAPSANRSGKVSPTTAQHVQDDLGGDVDLILDGGPCTVGVESTIIDLSGEHARLLRPGGIAVEDLERLIGPLERAAGEAVIAPGMLPSHYAPILPLRLDAGAPCGREALLAFGPHPHGGYAAVLNLSATSDLEEAAANLFGHLRQLDRLPVEGIAVMPVPGHGLGLAINDRLRRAAAPR